MKWREKNNLKVTPLPQWPSPAGRGRWDVPWLRSDTFITTKNNNSSETKTHDPQRQTEGGEGDQTGLAKTC